MAGVFRAALDAGMQRTSKGSMAAPLHYMASFMRSKRTSLPAPYTINDPAKFTAVDTTQPKESLLASVLRQLPVRRAAKLLHICI